MIRGRKPLVSIGMPVFNGEDYLRKALDSLLAQDYVHFELIISDNASTDRTMDICQEYQESDSRIRYYRNDQNMGMMWNFGRVLELAQGEYFMWAAYDDLRKPEFISTLLDQLESHPEAGIAMSATDLVLMDGKLFTTVRFNGVADPKRMGHFRLLMRSAGVGRGRKKYSIYFYGLYRRDLLQSSMRYYVDTLYHDRLFICMMALVTRFRYVDQVLYVKMRHPKYVERYPDEQIDEISRSYLGRYQVVFQLARMLWQCDLIPFNRKLYIPGAMVGIAAFITRGINRELIARKNQGDNHI